MKRGNTDSVYEDMQAEMTTRQTKRREKADQNQQCPVGAVGGSADRLRYAADYAAPRSTATMSNWRRRGFTALYQDRGWQALHWIGSADGWFYVSSVSAGGLLDRSQRHSDKRCLGQPYGHGLTADLIRAVNDV
ncbi:unnamed protein product [Periconia digitata]|uniref:Uncharacterized protein n=1 Tax=Periconia digitata TaxID=1303443 RepID=A0A9W4XUY7_9PLEO|nr:unnamed protein product [Periconia digitata]